MLASHRSSRRADLPPSFLSIREILDESNRVGNFADVIGAVRDFRAPVATSGTDWKCQLRLFDHFSEDGPEDNILLDIFWPEKHMPDVGLHDVIVIYQAKIQRRECESASLMTNHATDIHVYSAYKIPPLPSDAWRALKPSARTPRRKPGLREHEYVFKLSRWINKVADTSPSNFETMKVQSTNIRNKFRELKDIQENVFCDVIVSIVRDPFDMGDKYTLWVSDYSENQNLFNFIPTGLDPGPRGGNPYGYITSADDAGAQGGGEWSGPYGRRSLQVTCYEPHASLIRERKLAAGEWVLLRNMQIKYGRNNANLEGYLREDRGAARTKINIIPMDPTDNPERIDARLKEAIRRKRDYEKMKKEQLKSLSEAAQAGMKRKIALAEVSEQAGNTKQRRKARRAGLQPKSNEAKSNEANEKEAHEAKEAKEAANIEVRAEVPDLNPQVRCEHQDKPTSSLGDMLKPGHIEDDGVKLDLPFINANYRANVRVVNFLPSRLEDFARPRRQKPSEYNVLSDNSSESESESSSGSDSCSRESAKSTSRHWEWRFFLELEDATPVEHHGEKKQTVWVLVDNQSAQCLINLDASDLRRSPRDLEALRQRLFLLWGELEEHQVQARTLANGNDCPAHSGEEDEGGGADRKSRPQGFINRPFACCVRQYGVKVTEADRDKADAGDGKRWQRVFGLFGTRIST